MRVTNTIKKSLLFPLALFSILPLTGASAQSAPQVPLYLAFVLHMHQPIYNPGVPINWDYFNMNTDPDSNFSVRQVFDETGFCYRRPATIINNNPEAKLTVHFTGSLIEQLDFLAKNGFNSKGTPLDGIWNDYKTAVKTGRLEMISDGYYHPIFPLITKQDAELQVKKLLPVVQDRFQTVPKGFFPPEIAFDTSITPWLKELGFQWSLFDSFHIMNLPNKDKWSREYSEAAFRPHLSDSGGVKFIVIPREHWLGSNQSDGISSDYLLQQLAQIQKWNTDPARPFLVVIVTDGDNGWMRQAGGGYYDWFWPNLLDALKAPQNSWVKLATISEYLKNVYTPSDVIAVERGSWGVGGAHIDLSTWDSSAVHKQMWDKVNQVRQQLTALQAAAPEQQKALAWDYFAMAETSCYWFWNNTAWAQKSSAALDLALKAMRQAKSEPVSASAGGSPAFKQLKDIAVGKK
ncbi:MAG: hypothetical protein NTX59_07195 [Elusimicrobia bacterium]|nr:hypothetical protein [Elusimicrobiota bacterium]